MSFKSGGATGYSNFLDLVYNTGDGLKTLEAVAEGAVPTAVIPPTLKGMRAAGLL